MAARVWAALCALSLLLSSEASAVTLRCVPRQAIFDSLKASHSEVPAYRGVTASGALLEVLVGPDGSFTVFVTFPDGLSCPVTAGEGWRDVPQTAVDPAA